MRTLRPLAGLFVAAVGVVLLLGAVAAWLVGQHRDPTGAFTAELAPVHSDGYAIVVPDVAAATQRHGVARLLGAGHLRITASSADRLVLALAPSVEVSRHLDGVARTEVAGIGYASGAQPVSVGNIGGARVPAVVPRSWTLATDGRPLDWSMATDTPMSLVVLRADGRPGLTVTLTAGLSRPSWGFLAGGLLLGGAAVVLTGATFLVFPAPRREVVLVVEADQVVDVADRIAAGTATGWLRRRARRGRLTRVPAGSYLADASRVDASRADGDRRRDSRGERRSYDSHSRAEAGASYVHTAT